MLSNFNMVGNWSKLDTQLSWKFSEIKFDDEVKRIFEEELDLQIKIFDHSAKINVTGNQNHCYIPCHYFLYVIKLIPFVSLVNKYLTYFEQLTLTVSDSDAVGLFLQNRNTTHQKFLELIHIVWNNFIMFLICPNPVAD